MKAINIVLSILILLLAAAAAVFSYFLFEKRSQFVTGWGKMAATINSASRELDQGSGTKVAAELTPEKLSHENYENIDQLLPKLPAQSKSIITERNVLAGALKTVDGIVGSSSGVTQASLQDMSSYNQKSKAVVSGVRVAIERRNKNYAELIKVARNDFQITIDRNDLLQGKNGVFKPMSDKLRDIMGQIRTYENFIASLSRTFQVKLSSRNAGEKVRTIDAGIRKYRADFAKKVAECNALSNAKKRLEREKASLLNVIQRQKAEIADRDGQIASYQRALGLIEVRGGAKKWGDGSKESRKALLGKVVFVDSKYGYIAVSIGRYTTVKQQIGNSTFDVNPMVADNGFPMIVIRRAGDKDEHIANVRLAKIGENSSIANIPAESKTIKVGDLVIWDEETAVADAKKPAKR